MKQARKGFRPPSAMKGIGYFQNLRNLLRNFFGFFGEFLGDFLGGFFWKNLFGGIFGRNFLEFFWEDFFGRIFLRGILWEEFFVYDGVSRFCLNKEGRKEGMKFRSLEVRRKLIALKNCRRVWSKFIPSTPIQPQGVIGAPLPCNFKNEILRSVPSIYSEVLGQIDPVCSMNQNPL